MSQGDARFEDADERPLRLRAETGEDLAIISALAQDAVSEGARASWTPRRRRFTLLLNRLRWEDVDRARLAGRPFERVQSLLVIESALKVRAQGVEPGDRDVVLCVLSIGFDAREDGSGTVTITLAGDGAFAIEVECLDVCLLDVTRPYLARSASLPQHEAD